jgi:CRISPR-associated protein Cas1
MPGGIKKKWLSGKKRSKDMGWRILQITKPCRLSVKNSQLVYETEDCEKLTLPLEDISVLILENKQILLNSFLLSALSDNNIVLISCDATHTPSGVFFPFHAHSRYSETAWQQVAASEPLKKRLWQEIVKAKITNQAMCLALFNRRNADKLKEISKQVQSGDAKNAEAFAANIYWKSLFNDFNRNKDDDIRNAALNYGYAIIRGCMARFAVGAGLLPCFGVHHANKLNQFNLVDDLMEPFRPFVDYEVATLDLSATTELTTDIKHKLVNVLTKNCIFKNEELNLLKCCELTSISMAKAMKNNNIKELELPLLKKIPLFE